MARGVRALASLMMAPWYGAETSGCRTSEETMEKLIAEAERILGIEIREAPSGRHYYYAEETSAYYWVTAKDLRVAHKIAEQYPQDAYSHWCAGTTSREMSAAARRQLGLA